MSYQHQYQQFDSVEEDSDPRELPYRQPTPEELKEMIRLAKRPNLPVMKRISRSFVDACVGA
jgi:hypothetical protein